MLRRLIDLLFSDYWEYSTNITDHVLVIKVKSGVQTSTYVSI